MLPHNIYLDSFKNTTFHKDTALNRHFSNNLIRRNNLSTTKVAAERDDENQTVKFLYGPLIIGICSGVVVIVVLIGKKNDLMFLSSINMFLKQLIFFTFYCFFLRARFKSFLLFDNQAGFT